MINFSKHKNVLVVGAGSGRDIANAVFVTEYLKQFGIKKISLAGFLTPWAVHYFGGKIEKPINRKIENSYKVLANNKSKKLDSYFEYLLPRLNDDYNLGLKNIFLFSLHHGYKKLEKSMEAFIQKNNFDLIIIVDVGGDILVNNNTAKDAFTPFVDLVCLKIFRKIKNIDRFVFVIAPGVDGEIDIKNQRKIINDIKKYETINIKDLPESLDKLYKVNQQINKLTHSKSGTEKMIKKIADGFSGSINFSKIYNGLPIKYKVGFSNKLDKYSSKIFIFNIEVFKNTELVSDFKSIYDLQSSLRNNFCGSELDMSYIPIGFSDKGYKEYIFSLTPMDRVVFKQ